MSGSPVRYLLYSHDTYGLGHFRRSTLIANGIVTASPDAQVLIATGAPQAQAFSLPDRVDSLKLPSVTKDPAGHYRARRISIHIDELVRLRASLLAAACVEFRPDVVVVDQAPMGMCGELVPMLQHLDRCRRRPRLVLGLRDIVDEAASVEAQWTGTGVWSWIDHYDDVFVYGDASILSTARELRLADRTRASVTHTGYVAPVMPEPLSGDPFVLVTPGGGGDGQHMLRAYLDAVEDGALDGMRSIVVTGPLMSAARRAQLVLRAGRLPGVDIIEFTDNLRQLVASAAGVVSMAGYNTVVEELAARTPAMLVPRTVPRLEQDLRARRLGPHTDLERCPLEHLTPPRVAAFVERIGNRSVRSTPEIDLGGVHRVASLLVHQRTTAREHAHV